MTAVPDPRPTLHQAFAQSSMVIAAVQPSQLELATPCPRFDVRTLIGHMCFAADRIGQAGRGEMIAEDGPAVGGIADDGWAAAFDASSAAAVAAWDGDTDLAADCALPFGTFPAHVVVAIYMLEQVTHAWDLAAATGTTGLLDPGLGEAALQFAHGMIRPELRGEEPMPFGLPVEVPGDAPVYDRLAGFMGRDPSFAAVGAR